MTEPEGAPRSGFFHRLKAGLSKTRELLFMNVGAIARGVGPVDEGVLAELEEALILADAGAELSHEYVESLRAAWRRGELPDVDSLRARLRLKTWKRHLNWLRKQSRSMINIQGYTCPWRAFI